MFNEHITFPNPTINEALCEIHFLLPEGIEWDPSIYGRFFVLIQAEFPLIEPILGSSIRMRYRHRVNPLLIQLSEGVFTVNVLAKYPGWQQMKTDTLNAWSWLREIIGPVELVRVGLRYINFIPVGDGCERLGDWLATNQYVASSVLNSRSSSSRSEIYIDEQTKAIITVGEIANVTDLNERKFVLDIDAIAFKREERVSDLSDTIKFLHDDVVWKVFDSFRTTKLTDFLKQE